jgi:iron uptake system component EfeO
VPDAPPRRWGWASTRTRWAGLAAVVVVAAAVVVLWPGSGSDAAGDPEISVSRSDCGQGWTAPKPGPQTFQLHNIGTVTAEVDLIDPATGTIFGEVEGLGAGTTRPLSVTLGNGDYAFRCLPDEAPAIVGPAAHVSGGDARSGPAVVPVTNADLIGPLKVYRDKVIAGLGVLVSGTDALKAAVAGGDRGASEAAWLTAHLSYERLGAAYDAFGDSDGALNGTTDGLPGGVTDPGFTGFHRLEYGLWHGEAMPALAAVVDQLDTDAHGLQQAFPTAQIDQNDLGLRAHEIMENALQFELTGKTDYGSGTNLATALANVDGTVAVLDVLRPLLSSRFPALSEVDSWLTRTKSALQSGQRPDGGWTPVARLGQAQREKINGAVSELTELLAPIAAITEPRRVS